ncbi:MAG: purine-binding chemotaxis protein CheW [Methylobacteriaceae bacterium]|nr:purine-binding chemotaxis protein CheW [Methylobacteriaceae bacterium]
MHDVAGLPAKRDDCWNRIGVYGDASCPQLKQHAHCRNCPIYSGVAMMLLDRQHPAGYLEEWIGYVSAPRSKSRGRTRHSAIVFRIGAEWFALPTLVFDEVAPLRAIHSVPHRRAGAVLGVVNVRGELLICVSLAQMLGLGDAEPHRAKHRTSEAGLGGIGRLVVIRHESGRIAFPVDEVVRTHRYYADELKAVPATIAKATSKYTKGMLAWRDRMVGCLDEQLIVQTLNRSVA